MNIYIQRVKCTCRVYVWCVFTYLVYMHALCIHVYMHTLYTGREEPQATSCIRSTQNHLLLTEQTPLSHLYQLSHTLVSFYYLAGFFFLLKVFKTIAIHPYISPCIHISIYYPYIHIYNIHIFVKHHIFFLYSFIQYII